MAEKIVVIAADSDAETIRIMLEQEGYEAVTTASPPLGLRYAVETAPQAIVCDGDLPSMGGRSIAKLLKANPITAAVPLILITDDPDVGACGDYALPRGFESGALLHALAGFRATGGMPGN